MVRRPRLDGAAKVGASIRDPNITFSRSMLRPRPSTSCRPKATHSLAFPHLFASSSSAAETVKPRERSAFSRSVRMRFPLPACSGTLSVRRSVRNRIDAPGLPWPNTPGPPPSLPDECNGGPPPVGCSRGRASPRGCGPERALLFVRRQSVVPPRPSCLLRDVRGR